MNQRLQARLRKRRKKALSIYIPYLAVFLALALWVALDFRIGVQITVFLVCLPLFYSLHRIRLKYRLAGAFSRAREGVILEVRQKLNKHYVDVTAIGRGIGEKMHTWAVVDFAGHPTEIELLDHECYEIFCEGDRILYHPQFAAPMLFGRRPAKSICPLCGRVTVQTGTAPLPCYACGLMLPFDDKKGS